MRFALSLGVIVIELVTVVRSYTPSRVGGPRSALFDCECESGDAVEDPDMSDRTNYTFTVLRYVHDITTGEFVNVGVVLHAPKAKFLRARMRSTYGRISRFFPGAHGENIKRVITQIETAVL